MNAGLCAALVKSAAETRVPAPEYAYRAKGSGMRGSVRGVVDACASLLRLLDWYPIDDHGHRVVVETHPARGDAIAATARNASV